MPLKNAIYVNGMYDSSFPNCQRMQPVLVLKIKWLMFCREIIGNVTIIIRSTQDTLS